MVAKGSKSFTPATSAEESHPAYSLKIGSVDQKQTLAKHHPVKLPNQNEYNTEELVNLRASFKYIYVINWLYNFRGFLKLQSELFDVDLFELELLNYFPSGGYGASEQQSVLFIDKLKLNLISILQNSKLSSLNNFEKIFRLWFGIETPLGGKEEEEDEAEETAKTKIEEEVDIKFDQLKISDKFEILYILISYISNYSKFRDWIDKTGLTFDQLRVNSIFTPPSKNNSQDEYFLLFEDNRLYKRTITYNQLVIPKKRKLSPENPNEYFNSNSFDVNMSKIKFELVYKDIYELNEYLKKSHKIKPIVTKISKTVDAVFNHEIRKRKFLINKRKEIQLVTLLATRKRSSRLEAKEKQRQQELELQRQQEEIELALAAEKRFERRTRLKEQQLKQHQDFTNGLTREERLRLRLDKTPAFTPTPEVEVVSLDSEGETAEFPVTIHLENPEQVKTPTPSLSHTIIDLSGPSPATTPNTSETTPIKTTTNVHHIQSQELKQEFPIEKVVNPQSHVPPIMTITNINPGKHISPIVTTTNQIVNH